MSVIFIVQIVFLKFSLRGNIHPNVKICALSSGSLSFHGLVISIGCGKSLGCLITKILNEEFCFSHTSHLQPGFVYWITKKKTDANTMVQNCLR